MKHEESRLQQQCVAWFRAQYPQYAMLLTHPANEGNGNRVTGAIHKAEGTQAGVPDLLLFLPTFWKGHLFACLGIELKTKTGKQSEKQKDFELMFMAAGSAYVVVRSIDEFCRVINNWLPNVPGRIKACVAKTHNGLEQQRAKKELDRFKKVLGKK